MFNVGEDWHMLPHMYWLPKLHKNPPKPRFIIAAPNCTVKKLSKALTCILKLFIHQMKRYCQVFQHFGPQVYPRGSLVIALVRWSVHGPSLNISETAPFFI